MSIRTRDCDRRRWVFAAVALVSLGAWAAEPTMNGFALDDFPQFWRSWHLVTVRNRTDTGELRFIYANDRAWEVLQRGGTNYPDGAVLGKVGFLTASDPLFPSSQVPTRAARYQVMVMDRARFPATHGWGYALFLEDGRPTQDDHATTTAACAACHELAAPRAYVFAQPAQAGVLEGKKAAAQLAPGRSALTFETVPVTKVPALKPEVPRGATTVRIITGPIVSTVFAGFGGPVNELQPALAAETLRAHLPAGVVSEDGTKWMLMYAVPDAAACHAGAHTGQVMRFRFVDRASSHDEAKTFCL